MIEASFDLIASFCSVVFVVLDHDTEAITAALGDRSYTVVHGDADAPMFESIRSGLTTIAAYDSNAPVLLHPGDQPAVLPTTVQHIVEAFAAHPRCAILPRYDDRGGHPVLIPPELLPRIVAFDGHDGLRGFWHTHAARCHRVVVDDPAAAMDVNTPEQYRSLLADRD